MIKNVSGTKWKKKCPPRKNHVGLYRQVIYYDGDNKNRRRRRKL